MLTRISLCCLRRKHLFIARKSSNPLKTFGSFVFLAHVDDPLLASYFGTIDEFKMPYLGGTGLFYVG